MYVTTVCFQSSNNQYIVQARVHVLSLQPSAAETLLGSLGGAVLYVVTSSVPFTSKGPEMHERGGIVLYSCSHNPETLSCAA